MTTDLKTNYDAWKATAQAHKVLEGEIKLSTG